MVLVRISDDREGEAKGVARQQQDCRRHAQALNWEISEIVVENDTSAFKRRKVRLPDGSTGLRVIRPGFRRVLDMLASGEADGLIAYDLDRTCRDPRDLEDLIDVVEARRVPVTSVSGSLRLANDADITMARVMVAVANKSSRDTSRRVARKHEELAESGKPGGGGRRPYGYDQNGMTVREEEAAIVRQMLAWALDGWSIRQITGELNARLEASPDTPGLRPAYSERWSTRSVSAILRGPRIAGLRRFRGEVVGEAAWPAIVDRNDWERVQPGLDSRAAGTKNQLVRWLTGVLQCGLCGHQMYGWTGHGGPRYWCATPKGGCGKIAVNVQHVEAEIARQILEYLSTPGVLAKLRGTYSSEAVADARAELAADEQQLKELAAMWAQRQISFAEYSEARRIISDRIAASRVLVRSSLPQTVRLLLDGDVRAGWAELTPAGRRDVVLTMVSGYRVNPAGSGPRVFNPGRLVPLPLE